MSGQIRVDGKGVDQNVAQEPEGVTEWQLGNKNELIDWRELEEALDQFEEFFRRGFPALHPSL